MTIEDWRARIDGIDKKFLELLTERAKCVIEVGNIKREHKLTIFDPERERQIIANILSENKGPLDENALRRIFECVINECRRIETHG